MTTRDKIRDVSVVAFYCTPLGWLWAVLTLASDADDAVEKHLTGTSKGAKTE